MKKLTILLAAVLFTALSTMAQVAINKDGTDPDANSILHVKGDATNKNVLFDITGKVGIGSTNPFSMLTVKGLETDTSFAIIAGTDTTMVVTGYGDVGIGTTNPKRNSMGLPLGLTLTLLDDFYARVTLRATESMQIDFDDINGPADTKYGALCYSEQKWNFETCYDIGGYKYDNILVIDGNTGKVGIGTMSPNEKLEVNGSIRMTDGNQGAGKVMVSDANGTAGWANASTISDGDWTETTDSLMRITGTDTLMTITNTGYVGIGTTNPSAQFEVLGIDGTQGTAEAGSDISLTAGTGGGANEQGPVWAGDGGHINIYAGHGGHGAPLTGDGRGGDINIIAGSSGIGGPVFNEGGDIHITPGAGTFIPGDVFIGGNGGDVLISTSSNGKVGIGTTSPDYMLQISGDIAPGTDGTYNLGATTLGWDTLFMSSTIDYGSNLGFTSGGSEKITFATNGNVGIGTTSPNEKLEVNGSIRMNDGNQGVGKVMVSGDIYGTASWADASTISDGDWTVNGFDMYSVVNGCTGIGTNTPKNKLDVSEAVVIGNSYAGIETAPKNGLLVEGNVGIGTTSPNNAKLEVSQATSTGSTGLFARNLASASTTAPVLAIRQTNGGDDQSAFTILQEGTGAGIVVEGSGTGYSAIFDIGNVGIGTTSPSHAKLQVNQATTSGNTGGFYRNLASASTDGPVMLIEQDNAGDDQSALEILQDGTGAGIVVDGSGTGYSAIFNNGNVGIGTTSPTDAKFKVIQATGAGCTGFFYRDLAIAEGPVMIIKQDNAGDDKSALEILQDGTGAGIVVDGSGTGYSAIFNNGNVGIGTTNPTNHLEISAAQASLDINATSGDPVLSWEENGADRIEFFYSTSQNRFELYNFNMIGAQTRWYDDGRIYLNSKVGIGTTDPKSKLQVDGGVQVGDDSDAASADKVGTIRYRVSGNNSYAEMCMQTGASTYAWIVVSSQSW